MMVLQRWDYSADLQRGTNLPLSQERDIQQTPRPVKPDAVSAREDELHRLRADTVRSPDDTLPLQLHDTHELDRRGTPALAEAFLVRLSGETATSERVRRLVGIIASLEEKRRVHWAVLAEYYRYARSEEEIASELFLSQQTVSRIIRKGTAWVHARYMALYGDDD